MKANDGIFSQIFDIIILWKVLASFNGVYRVLDFGMFYYIFFLTIRNSFLKIHVQTCRTT